MALTFQDIENENRLTLYLFNPWTSWSWSVNSKSKCWFFRVLAVLASNWQTNSTICLQCSLVHFYDNDDLSTFLTLFQNAWGRAGFFLSQRLKIKEGRKEIDRFPQEFCVNIGSWLWYSWFQLETLFIKFLDKNSCFLLNA